MGTSAYPDEGPGPYFRHPPDIWHPSISAEEEQELATRPVKRFFYVAGQFLWLILSFPIWLLLVLVRWPSLPSTPAWGFRQRLIIPIMGRIFWATTILGNPRDETFEEARKDPSSFEIKYGRPRKDDPHGVTVDQLDLPIPDEDRCKNWFLPSEAGGVLDPNGIVDPVRVPTYSYWREPLEKGGTAFSLARSGETAALWLFRGGFISGHGLDPMAFEFCRRTGMRTFGASIPLRLVCSGLMKC